MAGIRLTGLWEKTAENGEVYYEGTWGGTILRVYTNKYKRDQKDPDCVVYLSEKKEVKTPYKAKPDVQQKPFQAAQTGPKPSFANSPPRKSQHPQSGQWGKPADDEAPWPTEDDVPF